MEWACGEKRVPVVGDPACPRRSEDELVDPTCSNLWSPLAQSRAQWGCWQDKWDSMCFNTPRPGHSRPESADMFCGPFSPENFFILQPVPWLCAFGGMGVLKGPGKQPWMGEWAVALCWICCVTLDKWCTLGVLV